MPARAFETGQFCLASSARRSNSSSVIPGTFALTSRWLPVMPAPGSKVTAAVTFDPGTGITGSHLLVSAKVAGISEDEFERLANEAKENCPVSKALAGIPITLEASLA